MYEIRHNNEHYELYVNGKFYCSADTFTEAAKEIDNMRFKGEEQWVSATLAASQIV